MEWRAYNIADLRNSKGERCLNKNKEIAAAVDDPHDLTQGAIVKKLLLFALPIIAGNIVQQLYNVVDTIVVGRFVGPHAIAAVSVAFPAMMVFNCLFMGLGMGSNIIIAQKRGAGDMDELTKAITSNMALTIYGGLIITVLGLVLGRGLLELLNTPADIIDDATTYLNIIMIGTIGNMMYNSCNGLVRGMGDSKWSFYALLISSVINVVLDIVFVAVFHWDVAGVAIATTLAHIISAAILFYRVAAGKYPGRINLKRLHVVDKDIFVAVLRLGIPSSLQSAASSVGNMLIQSYSNSFGTLFISANSIAIKVDGFAIMPLMGLGMAVTTFVGQNIGANKDERAAKGVRSATVMVITFGLTLGVILSNFGIGIMRLFTDDMQVLTMAQRGLRVLAITYCFMGMQNVWGGSMRGCGSATAPAVVALTTTFARIPVAYFLAVKPLREMADAAVAAGEYATRELAIAGGVGVNENMLGMFISMAFSVILGAVLIGLYYFFGNWKAKAIRFSAPNGAPAGGPGPKGAPRGPMAPPAAAAIDCQTKDFSARRKGKWLKFHR